MDNCLNKQLLGGLNGESVNIDWGQEKVILSIENVLFDKWPRGRGKHRMRGINDTDESD